MTPVIYVRVTLRCGLRAHDAVEVANEVTGATWTEPPTRPFHVAGGQHTNGPTHWTGTLAIEPEELRHWVAYVRPHDYEILRFPA